MCLHIPSRSKFFFQDEFSHKHRHNASAKWPFTFLNIFSASTLGLSITFTWFATWHSFTKIQLPWQRHLSVKYCPFFHYIFYYQFNSQLLDKEIYVIFSKKVFYDRNACKTLVHLYEQARVWWKYIGGLIAMMSSNTVAKQQVWHFT